MNFSSPPTNLEQLTERMEFMAGLTLGEIAEELQVQVPESLVVEKGWAGQLIEAYLGASAGNLPEPDFQHLGIELKTIPISSEGKPFETTFVCVAPLTQTLGETWRTSSVYKKLRHVLWVPIVSDKEIPIPYRQVATPFLWQMTPEQEAIFESDWNELTELIVMGHHDKISAKHGEILQLRPKAADSSVRSTGFDQQGRPVQAPPKGFYIRTSFTRQLLQSQFQLED